MYSDVVEENKRCVPQWKYECYSIMLVAANYRQHVHASLLAYNAKILGETQTVFQAAKLVLFIAKPCHLPDNVDD